MTSVENMARQVLSVKPIRENAQSSFLPIEQHKREPGLLEASNTVIQQIQKNIDKLTVDLERLQERFDMDDAFEELDN